MKIKKTIIKNTFIINFDKKTDKRGYFLRQYCLRLFKKNKLNTSWVQINKSFNKDKFTFRGLHFQKKPYEEIKIVQCTKGKILDVLLDLRKNSKSFLKTACISLSSKKNELLYIPKGVAHGYLTLLKNTELMYFHSEFFNPRYSMGVNIKDNKIKFKFKKKIKIISSRDKNLKLINEL